MEKEKWRVLWRISQLIVVRLMPSTSGWAAKRSIHNLAIRSSMAQRVFSFLKKKSAHTNNSVWYHWSPESTNAPNNGYFHWSKTPNIDSDESVFILQGFEQTDYQSTQGSISMNLVMRKERVFQYREARILKSQLVQNTECYEVQRINNYFQKYMCSKRQRIQELIRQQKSGCSFLHIINFGSQITA